MVLCTALLLDATKHLTESVGAVLLLHLFLLHLGYCKLFRELLDETLPREYLRLLLNIYTNHVTCVLWNGICSAEFSVKNGVKQGGVISPVLFCIYIDATSGSGCFIVRSP